MEVTTARLATSYCCIVTDAAGNTATSEATSYTEVPSTVSITAQSNEKYETRIGSTATLSVTAKSISGNLAYQWYYSADNGQTWKKTSVKGNKTAKITMNVTAERFENYLYRCKVTDGSGNVVRSTACMLVPYK